MNTDRLVIASVACLALGLGLIFGYCHGTAGFSAAYPVAGASLQLSLTTTGLPAVAGFAFTVVGMLLLIWALVDAVFRQIELHAPRTSHQERIKS
jgi:uncharacterized membrane protein